jgi:hypothetical protein
MATIPELLDGHITLEVECLDRLYLNGYIGKLATGLRPDAGGESQTSFFWRSGGFRKRPRSRRVAETFVSATNPAIPFSVDYPHCKKVLLNKNQWQ